MLQNLLSLSIHLFELLLVIFIVLSARSLPLLSGEFTHQNDLGNVEMLLAVNTAFFLSQESILVQGCEVSDKAIVEGFLV